MLGLMFAAVAISAGLIVLLGYFLPGLEFIRSTVLGWASITAGFALLAGVLNLLSVHWAKITRTGGTAQTRHDSGQTRSQNGDHERG